MSPGTKTAGLIVSFCVGLTDREIKTIGEFRECSVEVIVNRLRNRALRRRAFRDGSDGRNRLLFGLSRNHSGNHCSTLVAAAFQQRLGFARCDGGTRYWFLLR